MGMTRVTTSAAMLSIAHLPEEYPKASSWEISLDYDSLVALSIFTVANLKQKHLSIKPCSNVAIRFAGLVE